MVRVRATNWKGLARRGASRDNTEYFVQKCKGCGAFALYEEEHMLLFQNCNKLRMNAGVLYGIVGEAVVACASCGAGDSFDDADESDLAAISASDWSFALADS